VLLRISDIIARQGAEIAFPTRTLHLAQEWQAAEPSIQGPARTAAQS
jgi:hypothetical protein